MESNPFKPEALRATPSRYDLELFGFSHALLCLMGAVAECRCMRNNGNNERSLKPFIR